MPVGRHPVALSRVLTESEAATDSVRRVLCARYQECIDSMDAVGAKSFTCASCVAYERMGEDQHEDELPGVYMLAAAILRREAGYTRIGRACHRWRDRVKPKVA